MSELRRWSAEDATAEELALLEAGRRVQPSTKAWARAKALGAGAAVATIGAAAPVAAATKSGMTLASKLVILSLVGGGVVAGAVAVRSARTRAAPPAHAELAAPGVPSREAARPEPSPAEPPTASASVTVVASAAPSAAPDRPRAAAPRPASSSESLNRELQALELAHQALAQHNPRTALGVLDRYRAQFPEGRLASEAVVLRVQALVALGDRAGAQALADAYSAANPGTPYARRLREIVQGQ
jgi:hypothetical protein